MRRAGVYAGSFEIYDTDGTLLDDYSKDYHRQPLSSASYNLDSVLWEILKNHPEWMPIDMICDYPAKIPNFIRRRVKATFESGRLDHFSDIGKLEMDEIQGEITPFGQEIEIQRGSIECHD